MSQSKIVEEPGAGRAEIFPLPTGEAFLHEMLKDAFENWWNQMVFGTLIQGAVFEIHAPNPPHRIGLLDGYLTVDFGAWHFHVCIGQNTGTRRNPTPPELARVRRTARAELVRFLRDDGTPRSWQLRLFNGRDENQLTIFFPNPCLDENDRFLKEPDWSRLAMWDAFRHNYLGLEPDPKDRTAHGFPCGGA